MSDGGVDEGGDGVACRALSKPGITHRSREITGIVSVSLLYPILYSTDSFMPL